jgi:hypothetical protein
MVCRSLLLLVILFSLAFASRAERFESEFSGSNPTIAKWYNNCAAAISLTYDDGCPFSKSNQIINRFVLENKLTIDYEIVTRDYLTHPFLKNFLLKKMIPTGLGYFGHGHTHMNHDKLSYEDALKSFTQCFRTLKKFGLKPVAYAYPKGAAKETKTRKALAESGFLCGRLHFSKQMTHPFIVPGTQMEPDDWFGLPTLVMQDYAFNQCDRCVNTNEQLISYLDETIRQNAWIILTYHAVGNEKGYGFFKYDEFRKNIYSISERNFWNASMNAITLYIRERLHAKVKIIPVIKKNNRIEELRITLSDNLSNDIYDQPLTVLLRIPAEWVNKTIALVENGQTIKTFLFNSSNAKVSIKPDERERRLIIPKNPGEE